MSEKEFLDKMQDEILDADNPIAMNQNLADINEWDSLAVVNFIAAARASGKKVDRQKIQAAVTVADLFELLK